MTEPPPPAEPPEPLPLLETAEDCAADDAGVEPPAYFRAVERMYRLRVPPLNMAFTSSQA